MKWVILIKSTLKIGMLFVLGILLVGQFTPSATFPIHAAQNDPTVLDIGDTQHVSVGDTFQLKITKAEKELQTSTIDFPDNITMDEDKFSHPLIDEIVYDTDTNKLIINWDMDEIESDITINLLVTDVGDIEIASYNLLINENEAVQSNHIYITVDPKEEEEEIADQEEQKSDENGLEKSRNEEDQLEEEQTEDHSAETIENEADATDQAPKRDQENKQNKTDEKQSKKNDTINNNDVRHTAKDASKVSANETLDVSDWDNFLAALDNPAIKKMNITSSFSTSGLTKEHPVRGDKIISGNQHTIDFHRERININEFDVQVEDLTIKADQLDRTNSSVFFSEASLASLHLRDTSFDGIQNGQVARMNNGHIIVSGTSEFQTKGHFEVFEAKSITFENDSAFIGKTTGRKEVFNLYNSPVITVGENAAVRLETKNRTSIMNVEDHSTASIELEEKARFEVHAATYSTSRGEALINLPGADSKISLAQDATLDIQNHREGKGHGSLLNVNGILSLNHTMSKVSFWDKGANTENESGNKYRSFPRILDGELHFNQDNEGTITSGEAGTGSTLSVSDNGEKNGKTFAETFTNRNTSEIKRLLISSAEELQKPVIDSLSDQDDTITGTATPGVTVEIRDEANDKTWTTTTDATTGEYSILLDEYAPYKAGSELYAKTLDSYGFESDLAIINIIGATLEFYVPEALTFQPTMVESEIITIPRDDPDWSVHVTDSREQGSEWEVTAKAESPLTSEDGHRLDEDSLVFMQDGKEQSLKDGVLIHQGVTGEEQETDISWDKDEGILIKLNPIASDVRTNTPYSTTIEWTLTDAP